jgi:hypothetical protein
MTYVRTNNPAITAPTFPMPHHGTNGYGWCGRCGHEVEYGPRGGFVAFCHHELAFLNAHEVMVSEAKAPQR